MYQRNFTPCMETCSGGKPYLEKEQRFLTLSGFEKFARLTLRAIEWAEK
jgi:hypothetical protein